MGRSEITPGFIGAGRVSSEPSVFTEYMPSIGNLFELNQPAGFLTTSKRSRRTGSAPHRKVNAPQTSTSLFSLEYYAPYVGSSRISHTHHSPCVDQREWAPDSPTTRPATTPRRP